jgi:ATP-dependent protease ClpP protease subunit
MMMHAPHRGGCIELTRDLALSYAEFITQRCPRISLDMARSMLDKNAGRGTFLNQDDAERLGIIDTYWLEAGKSSAKIPERDRLVITTEPYVPATCLCHQCIQQRAAARTSSPILRPAARRLSPIPIAGMPTAIRNLVSEGNRLAMSFKDSTGPNVPAEFLLFGEVGNPEDGADASTVSRFLRNNKGRPIDFKINSPGGSVFDGLAIFNSLTAHDAAVFVTVEGLAGSAASIAMMAGQRISIRDNANVFVHRASVMAAGNRDVLAESIVWLDKIDIQIAKTYAARTGRPFSEMQRLMVGAFDGTLMSASEALARGFVDKILPTPAKTNTSNNADALREARLHRNRKTSTSPTNADTLRTARIQRNRIAHLLGN